MKNEAKALIDAVSAILLISPDANGPHDHGFALVVSFRGPDGNHIEVLETKGG